MSRKNVNKSHKNCLNSQLERTLNWFSFDHHLMYQLEDRVENQLCDQLYDQLDGELREPLLREVEDEWLSSLWNHLKDELPRY